MKYPLKRFYGLGHLHFITCSCYRRKPLLASAHARDLLLKILHEVRQRFDFGLVGYVVMPEHIHLAGGTGFRVRTGHRGAADDITRRFVPTDARIVVGAAPFGFARVRLRS